MAILDVRAPSAAPGAQTPAASGAGDARRGVPGDGAHGRRRVARALQEHGASTVAQLAEQLEITPAGVRRHLDALLADGLVEAREQRSTGPRGRGRPARAFLLTAAGHDSFDTAYDDLAAAALRFLGERAGKAAVDDFARARAARLADRLRPAVTAAPAGRRVEALAQALSEAGYAASAAGGVGGSGAQLCQHHCPVAHVAAEFPQLCDAETAFLAEVLGTHVQRLATIAHGDGVCTTFVPDAPVPPATTVGGAPPDPLPTNPRTTNPGTTATTTTRKRTSS